ncbi:MAG TPA: glycosyltransferase family 39 protein, partial [Thermodesulfovibrionales bacterium]|nr:glycosyltransferase family 39 protein [Thermodesulfovibrionales bacterium]
MLRDGDRILLPPLLALVSFLVFYVLRSMDDNRLTSWHWVFRSADPVKVFAALTIGCVLIVLLAGFFRWRQSLGSPLSLFRDLTASRLSPYGIFIVYVLCGMSFWNIPEVNIDAARYFSQAKYLELFGVRYFLSEWGKEVHAWTDMPLIPMIYGVVFRFIGESRFFVQMFTTSLFGLTGVLTFKTGQALWDEETGMYGAGFLLCIPYLYTQVPLMLVDVAVMFFLLLSIYAVIRALRSGGVWIAVASLSIFCTFLSKYSAWLMLSVLPVIACVFVLRSEEFQKRMCLTRAGLVFSVSLVLIGSFVFFDHDVIGEQVRLLLSYQKPALKRWEESFFSTFFFQIHPFLTVFALVSVSVATVRRDWRYLIISWLVLLVLILQIRRIRYVIMVFPLLALMASYGLRSI